MRNLNSSSKPKTKKRFSRSLHILGAILVVLVLIYSGLTFLGRPVNSEDNTYVDLVVPKGATTKEIGEILEDNGIIRSHKNFEFLSTVLLYNNKFKPGFYALSPSMDMSEIADTLINGIMTDDGFDIPAGYTLEQTAEALDQAGFVDKDKFIQIANSGIYNSQFDFLGNASSIEGFLLPTRYEINKEADENMIITNMLYHFDNFYTDELEKLASDKGLTARDVVILASIVEKQSHSDKDKDPIALDLVTRLKSGEGIEGGYPEKPLCSPSMESILAVLNCKTAN